MSYFGEHGNDITGLIIATTLPNNYQLDPEKRMHGDV